MSAQAGNKSAKSNGASHRMSNPKHAQLREKCWARGEKRKKANAARQKAQEAANRVLRSTGYPTPWEAAQQARAARRAADPNVQVRARLHRMEARS